MKLVIWEEIENVHVHRKGKKGEKDDCLAVFPIMTPLTREKIIEKLEHIIKGECVHYD